MAINLLSRAEPRRLNYLYMFCIFLLKKKTRKVKIRDLQLKNNVSTQIFEGKSTKTERVDIQYL